MWIEWEGIKQDITMEEFFEEIRNCNLDPERLVLKSYRDDDSEGLLLDYGLRKQFYIPRIDDTWDLEKLSIPLSERFNTTNVNIKPCPFCGSKVKLFRCDELRSIGEEGWVIQCTNDDCGFSTTNINGGYSYNAKQLVKKWNTRIK